jgi:molybdate transport system substrate-binding protein
MFKVSFTAAVVAVSILLQSPEIGTARAAEIQFLCAAALKSSLATLIPEFEKSSGDKVSIVYGTVGGLTDRILKGDAVDVAILSGPAIEELQKSGKVVAGSRTDIAKVGVGVFVRKGAARPDLSSTDAVKHSMLAARSIAYSDPAGGGSSGIYMGSLVNRLDIAAEMKCCQRRR